LFECEGSSTSKFWDTELRGADLVVRFGRCGTAGQKKIKSFPDAAAATKEQAKLIKEKLGKGYKEV
jgi:predicted DNA-binding WGR domain protein